MMLHDVAVVLLNGLPAPSQSCAHKSLPMFTYTTDVT